MFADQLIPAHKTKVMIHALATSKGWMKHKNVDAKMGEVTRWHVDDNGWAGPAYAVLIDTDGQHAMGRDLDDDGQYFEETGAGARGHNTDTIHIALVGGRGGSATDSFLDNYTPEQGEALLAAISSIQNLVGRPMKVLGHNEVANKACPCFDVQEWYNNKPQRKSVMQSTTIQATGGIIGTVATGVAPNLQIS